jgi:hypothetical protein
MADAAKGGCARVARTGAAKVRPSACSRATDSLGKARTAANIVARASATLVT